MATITKIIDSWGTPGVNCDFDLIDDWFVYLSNETNPDQVGILRGEHGWVGVSLDSFNSFAIPTTPTECPRLVGDPAWQAGFYNYGTAAPANASYLASLSISATLGSGNAQHFGVRGVQMDYLQVDYSAWGSANGGLWFDGVCIGVMAQVTAASSALETPLSIVQVVFTNCLFIGDGSGDCFYLNDSMAAGSQTVAFVNSVMAKGAYVTWGGNCSLGAYVINCVQMAKEGYGFQTNTPLLTASGNASHPPSAHSDQLSPVYTLLSSEGNPGIFANSSYDYSDYRLPAGSPLIDLGVMPAVPGWDLTSLKDVAGTARPRGNGFDIGLFEYPSVLDSSSLLLCF